MITRENVTEIVNKFGDSKNDSGKPEVQIAIFTQRIKHLTKHMEQFPKDNHSRRGLIMLVSKRRKFLSYLKKNNVVRYRQIIADLSLRK